MKNIFLILIFLFTTLICCNAVTFTINNIQDLESLASILSERDSQYDVTLNTDIDVSETSKPKLFSHPLGFNEKYNDCYYFSGTFEGNGFTIKNLKMEGVNSGLFCGLKNVEVRNLVIDDSCSFKGDNSASITSIAPANVTLRNITNKAPISEGKNLGGLIGGVGMGTEPMNNGKILIDACRNDGNIYGNFSGGLIGEVSKTNYFNVSIINTINNGNVVGKETLSGFIGLLLYNNDLVLNVMNSINNGDCYNIYYASNPEFAGGITGNMKQNVRCTITIDSFTNNGSMKSFSRSTAFSGGLIGYAIGCHYLNLSISNSANNGKIVGRSDVQATNGGIISAIVNSNFNSVVHLENNVNRGEFDCGDSNCICGGIVSHLLSSQGMKVTMINNTNNAPIDAKKGLMTGGIIGFIREGPINVMIDHGVNLGKLTAGDLSNSISGIVGYIDRLGTEEPIQVVLRDCENKGMIESSNGFCSGLIGNLEESRIIIDIYNSINKGELSCPQTIGIAKNVRNVNGVVIIGSPAYSFWEKLTGSSSNLFYKGICRKCPTNAKPLVLSGGYYYIVDE